MNTNSYKVYPIQIVNNSESFISMQNIKNSNTNISSNFRDNNRVNTQNIGVSYQGSNPRTSTQEKN